MKYQLKQLREEEKNLIDRLRQNIAMQDEVKAQMITDRLHKAGELSRRWAALELEIDLLRETLIQVRKHIEAELKRMNSSAMQNG